VDSLYLLLPISVLLVLIILGILGWAVHRGQFEHLEQEGLRILEDDAPPTGQSSSQRHEGNQKDTP
jgi:cbb3-type cytochrome oxidase maturation protein